MSDDQTLVRRLRDWAECEDDILIEAACADFHEAAERIEELEQLFDLRWAADMRAIKAWQIAHPDKPKTWPDHADLGTWCLSRIEALEAALREIIQEDALNGKTVFVGDFGKIARKALEGKDE